jgi:DNA-directed RNA polymerase subunit RPC12/RpoP
MYAASTKKLTVYLRGTIGCARCANAIHVYKVARLASEFTLRCPHCGTRSFYDKRTLMIEQLPERRRRPRN